MKVKDWDKDTHSGHIVHGELDIDELVTFAINNGYEVTGNSL